MASNEINEYAPIIMFTYNRLDHTKQTLEALKNNYGAAQSDLFIVSDASKGSDDKESVELVRRYIENTTGFKKVTIIKRKKNYGLGKNIISGISNVLNKYDSVIVLEDDIITSKFFLTYMNLALDKYKLEKKVMSISGYISPIEKKGLDDYFFMPWFECWGWATWKDRWKLFSRNPRDLIKNTDNKMKKFINVDGTAPDMWGQVIDNYFKKKYTWAIFYHALVCKNNGVVLYPRTSLCKNIGFDGSGDNCGISNDYNTVIEDMESMVIQLPDSYKTSDLAVRYFKAFNIDRIKKVGMGYRVYLFVITYFFGVYKLYYYLFKRKGK